MHLPAMHSQPRTLLALTILGATSLGMTQQQPPQDMHAMMNARFAKKTPRQLEMLPDATGFAEDGKPFALADTRGKITVLVAGCLT